jgi:hypothetical protein
MATKKLSPAQAALLRSVALGKVWRDDHGGGRRPPYAWYVQHELRNVSRTFDALYDAGLVAIDFSNRDRPVAVLTDAGREIPESLNKPRLEWEIQKQQHFGGTAIWANPGTLGRGTHDMRTGKYENPEEFARELVRDHLPRDGAYRIAIWDTVGVGKPPILIAAWNDDAIEVQPYRNIVEHAEN